MPTVGCSPHVAHTAAGRPRCRRGPRLRPRARRRRARPRPGPRRGPAHRLWRRERDGQHGAGPRRHYGRRGGHGQHGRAVLRRRHGHDARKGHVQGRGVEERRAARAQPVLRRRRHAQRRGAPRARLRRGRPVAVHDVRRLGARQRAGRAVRVRRRPPDDQGADLRQGRPVQHTRRHRGGDEPRDAPHRAPHVRHVRERSAGAAVFDTRRRGGLAGRRARRDQDVLRRGRQL